MIEKWLVTASLAALAASGASAQDAYVPITPLPLGGSLLSLQAPHIPAEGTWEVKFTHRFNQAVDQGSGSTRVHSLFGIDSNADVVFGASWSPRRDLEISLMRSNALDDIETAVKYVIVEQAKSIPLSVAVRAGGDWRTEANLTDRTSIFGQLILSRQFGRRFEVFALPTYATNAGRVATATSSAALFKHAGNVPVGAALMTGHALSLVAEFIPRNRDLPNGTKADYGWAFGVKRAIGGHSFEILVTNSNSTTVDQYVTTTYQGGMLKKGDVHLGFNIERRFGKR